MKPKYNICLIKKQALVVLLILSWPIIYAQEMPIITSSENQYILTIPYLEFTMPGSSKQAYAASLISTDQMQSFMITSATIVSLQEDASNISTLLFLGSSGFQLDIPFVHMPDNDTTYTMQLLAPLTLASFSVDQDSMHAVFDDGTQLLEISFNVDNAKPQSITTNTINSSTKLAASWSVSDSTGIHHYELNISETNRLLHNRIKTDNTETTALLTDLKADTEYTITLFACFNTDCSEYASSSPVSTTTDREYWQLQGSGNELSGLTQPVSDGNARISATPIGPEATSSNADSVQLYYGPRPQPGENPTLAVATGNKSADDASLAYLEFTSLAYTSGLISVHSDIPGGQQVDESDEFAYISFVATGQGVPLQSGAIRLFFEALGTDKQNRIFSIDSDDGYLGLDFNNTEETRCSTAEDYASGGGCQPTLEIGVEGDSEKANTHIANARQQKVGYATQKDWRWDQSAGTFMVFTTDQIDGCSTSNMNHGYAVWNGHSHWQVQYESDGCPKLFKSAQACLPIHLGEAKYKMYCGDPSQMNGKVDGSQLPFLGPKQLIYANGSSSGDIGIVDFEDWEAQSLVRDVVFLWPDGSQLDEAAEGYIDDYHFLAPTGDLNFQVMYLAITDGESMPQSAIALLLNP